MKLSDPREYHGGMTSILVQIRTAVIVAAQMLHASQEYFYHLHNDSAIFERNSQEWKNSQRFYDSSLHILTAVFSWQVVMDREFEALMSVSISVWSLMLVVTTS